MRRLGWLAIAACLLMAGCADREEAVMSEAADREAPSPGDTAGGEIRALADEFLAAYLEHHPETGTYLGIPGSRHDRLSDNSLAALATWQAREDAWLQRTRDLDTGLEPGDPGWATLGILREMLEASVQVRICREELWGVSETAGWQTLLPYLAEIQPIGSDSLHEQALARARALTGFLDTEIANLREGLRLGYATPKHNVTLVIAQIRGLMAPGSPLGSPGARSEDASFQAAYARVVADDVHPALQRYLSFLETDYLPAARDTISVAELPDGAACYRALIRAHSTLRKTPREIHDLGIVQMAHIKAEMQEIAARSFATSDVPALLERLQTDPQYTFTSREAILDYAHAAAERARAEMPRWFGRVPHADFRIEPYPADREATGTGEYQSSSEDGSRPGVFYIPALDPQRRPRAGLESLTFHETIPGHHLQGAIALELGDRVHPIARYLYNSGYSEGWGLYSERLADQMGLYSSDLDRIGMLSDQAGRAARLVIDTGIHAFGWTRERAIEYLAAHTTWARADVEAEIDRYIIYPGQATAYMLGMLEIRRLRDRAAAAHGDSFNIRAFHDRVLDDGSVPLELLEQKIEHWIATGRKAGAIP